MHCENESIDHQFKDARCLFKAVDEKFHRQIPSLVGPPVLERLIIADQSFPGVQKIVDWDGWRWSRQKFVQITDEGYRKLKQMQMPQHSRDEFGFCNLYQGAYSLNKAKRWLIPGQIRDEIKSMQNPSNGLRVSLLESFYRTAFTGSKFFQAWKWERNNWLIFSVQWEKTPNMIAWHTVEQKREIHRFSHGGFAGNLIWPIAPYRKIARHNPVIGHSRKCDRQPAIAQLRSGSTAVKNQRELKYWQLPLHVAYRIKEPIITKHMVNTEYKRRHNGNKKSSGRNFTKSRFESEKRANAQLCIASTKKDWLFDNEPDYVDYYDHLYETQSSCGNDWDQIENALFDWDEVLEADEAEMKPSNWTLTDFMPNNFDDFEFVKQRQSKHKIKKR